jgi:hypothetical protein
MMMARLVAVPVEDETIISPPTLRRAVDQVFETDNLVQSILGQLPPAFRFVAATKGLRRNCLTADDGATNTSVAYALQAVQTARVWAAEQPAGFDCVDRMERYATIDVMRDFLQQQDYPWSADLAGPLRNRELQLILELTCAFNKSSPSSSCCCVDNDSIILPSMDDAEAMRVIEAMIPQVPPMDVSSLVGPPHRLIQYQWQHQSDQPHLAAPLPQQAWAANEARIAQWLATPHHRRVVFATDDDDDDDGRIVIWDARPNVGAWRCQACSIPNDDTNATRCQVCGSVRN